ncbi:hypothetical protein D5F01_LYC20735 [Larimichthys crocea]|uniref:Uncharacterized protein n=1 Tax=Larimichthys crocea TaxID=215358 RepID=A0A6G0HRA5_LARCR|nr:hypothetical protein D5F01_LYC20735 [Larimichthys crocea]
MPRKGKRSQAQKVRWARLDLADPAPVSPTTSTHQMPETPPPTSRLWAMENAPTPTNSPAYKIPKIQSPQQSKNWMTSGEQRTDAPTAPVLQLKRSGRYGVFDSHSRNARGLPYPDGTAIVLIFSHLSDLISHLHRLFEDRGNNASYEFVPVSFDPVDKSCERHGTETGFGEELPESDVETSKMPSVYFNQKQMQKPKKPSHRPLQLSLSNTTMLRKR